MKTALHIRSFRLFLGGSFFSLLGDYIGLVALNWVIWENTHSAFHLGLINFVRLLPTPFIGMLAGILADKYSRKKLLILVYISIISINIIIFFITLNGEFKFFIIATMLGLRGVFVEMEPSLRNALLPDILKKEILYSSISLYTSIINLTAILGPAVAGLAIGKVGVHYLFLYHSLILLGSILSLVSTYFILFFLGLLSQAFRTANRIYFQIHTPDNLRGRIISIFLSDRGFIPIGALFIGLLTQFLDISIVFILYGVSSFCFILFSYYFYYLKIKKELLLSISDQRVGNIIR